MKRLKKVAVLFVLLNAFIQMPDTSAMTSDSLLIFSPKTTYNYVALFINAKGDTLSKENILIKPSGKPWKFDKKQTAFSVSYNYTIEDSLTFLHHINPQTKKTKKPKQYIWYRYITTGAIENNEQIWMHPIRDNQYNYTEIAPFPSIKLDSLHNKGTWSNKTIILMGWGAFNGNVTNDYMVVKKEERQYGDLLIDNCWLIQSIGEHSKLGKNYLDFYFHATYGFVEMNYRFYDGTRISFVLSEVNSEIP